MKQKKVQNHKNEQRRQEMVPKERETCRVTENDYRTTQNYPHETHITTHTHTKQVFKVRRKSTTEA